MGIGAILVRRIEKELVHHCYLRIYLQIRADNVADISFYQALDYEAKIRISMGKLPTD